MYDDEFWLTSVGFRRCETDIGHGRVAVGWIWDKESEGVYVRVSRTRSGDVCGWKAVTGSKCHPRVAARACDAVLMCVDAVVRADPKKQHLLDRVMDAMPRTVPACYSTTASGRQSCGGCRYFIDAPVLWCSLYSVGTTAQGVCNHFESADADKGDNYERREKQDETDQG